jgi:nicotinate-nucleotide adenylyltransferase
VSRRTAVPDLRGALGVFGGTFDPIHVGHLAVAESARDELGLERVLFVPAGAPPHKRHRAVTAAVDRLAMVEAAIADNPGFVVSRIEIDRPGPSWTADTLATLAEGEGEGEGDGRVLALIVAADSYHELATWHEPERVLQLATLVVTPRDGYPDADASYLAREFPGVVPRVVFLDGPRIRLSASDLRARAAAGRSLRYLVPDAVAAYIGDHGLYQDRRRTDRP